MSSTLTNLQAQADQARQTRNWRHYRTLQKSIRNVKLHEAK